jgi:uncharacterized OsmC-like protein
MTDQPTTPQDPFANAGDTRLWIERTGTRRYIGHSSRGATVQIGSVGDEGAFSPGELLKIALAGCSGLTSDAPLARRLGPDYAATIRVGGMALRPEDRYEALADELTVDLSGLDQAEREKLLVILHRAIAEHCTVGRTLTTGATTTFTVAGES